MGMVVINMGVAGVVVATAAMRAVVVLFSCCHALGLEFVVMLHWVDMTDCSGLVMVEVR